MPANRKNPGVHHTARLSRDREGALADSVAGMRYVTTFGGSVWYGPETGDPGAGEDIDTPIVATRDKR